MLLSHFLFAIAPPSICLAMCGGMCGMWYVGCGCWCGCGYGGVLVRFTHELLLAGQDFAAALQDA